MKRALFLFLFALTTISLLEAEVIENIWIPLSDGNKLAARVWLPEDFEEHPVPFILEYLPYRKRDGTRLRDEGMYNWLVKEGYAIARVDIRGSGDSTGFMDDEYTEQEIDDAVEVIHYLAALPFCTGAVGMTGKSWGGFNSLQVAARAPEPLKAVIAVGFTDDRYEDDIHYMGGCLLSDNFWWGALMIVYQSLPLDREISGEGWREKWLQRVDHLPCWPALWMKHQTRDKYWKPGSVCENWKNIQCPVFAISGWLDGYTDPVFRVLKEMEVPKLALVGPWGHHFPHAAKPGPCIGYLQEAKRWWDYWLKGIETGIMEEPCLRAYVESWSSPEKEQDITPGYWVGEDFFEESLCNKLYLSSEGLVSSIREVVETELTVKSPLWSGLAGGDWLYGGNPGEAPSNQKMDDAHSLVFDTALLKEDCELLGFPKVRLLLSSEEITGQVCVRLCEVNPEGISKRVSFQVLNLSHLEGHEKIKELVPGEIYPVEVTLHACGYRFTKGNKIRLAISNNYWPMVWPSKKLGALFLKTEGSFLSLPVKEDSDEENQIVFEPPVKGSISLYTQIANSHLNRLTQFDELKKQCAVITEAKNGIFGEGVFCLDELGIIHCHNLKKVSSVKKFDPLTAKMTITQDYSVYYGEDIYLIENFLEMSCDESNYFLKGVLSIFENGELLKEKQFNEVIPREL